MPAELAPLFDDQITLEFGAAITYQQLAIQVDSLDLPGMAHWLRAQADEELVHANKFIKHVVDRDGNPSIKAIAAPKVEKSATALDVFEAALAHEELVSESIRELYRSCDKAGDLDARPLLTWFIDEQLEEEATVSEIIGRIKMIGDDGPGLLRLDAELGARTSEGTEAE